MKVSNINYKKLTFLVLMAVPSVPSWTIGDLLVKLFCQRVYTPKSRKQALCKVSIPSKRSYQKYNLDMV